MSEPFQQGKIENNSMQRNLYKNPNSSEESKDTQYYLITLEDSNGEHQQIRIFKNSDAAEIAFNFCKENNLDYKSMKYIKKNIQKIIEQFDEPNHKLFFLDNSYSSIQEVDEENMVSETTLLDNEANKEKIGNKNLIKEIKFQNFSDKAKNIINTNDNNKNNEINNKNNFEKNKENKNQKLRDNTSKNINNNMDNNIEKEKNFKNDNLQIQGNNIELIIKSNNINESKKSTQKTDEIIKNKEDLNKPINQIQYTNKNEKQNESVQEPKNINIKTEQKKDFFKIDFEFIKEKMKNIRLKNSVLKFQNEKNKENLNEKKIFYKTERNSKKKNNINNTNLKKQFLLKDRINNKKKIGHINENIIDKFIKNLNTKQNSKIKNYNNLKQEEASKGNKTFTENKKSLLKKDKEKESISKKKDKHKNTILSHKTDILNNDKIKLLGKENENIIKKEKLKMHSTRLTPQNLSNLYTHKKESSNPKIIFRPKKEKILRLRNILQINKEVFSNLLTNIFSHKSKKSNVNKIMKNNNEMQNRIKKNKIKRRKNSYIGREEISKHSYDFVKSNDISKINFEKEMKILGTESRNKRITEMRKELDSIFNNNILKTNYVINKRCRIINRKNKKNISMNLSRYFSNSNKQNKSKKDISEINSSNNNFTHTYESEKENKTYKYSGTFTCGNSSIFSNNKSNLLTIINPKRNNSKYLKSGNLLNINNYNTNIKNYRVLNNINTYQALKKIIEIKNKINDGSSSKKVKKNNRNLDNINSLCSLLSNRDKSTNNMNNNDSNLKVQDQYYTINNTINITNNNSLMGNFMNNHKKNISYKNSKIMNIINKIFKYLDKENMGFILLNTNRKIKDVFLKNNLILNKEQESILEKIFKFLYDYYKKDNNFELDEDKIIINEKSFLNYMNYILKNKLNFNERNIFLSIANDNNINKKRIGLKKIDQRNLLNKCKKI